MTHPIIEAVITGVSFFLPALPSYDTLTGLRLPLMVPVLYLSPSGAIDHEIGTTADGK
jgi:hypothetical protein